MSPRKDPKYANCRKDRHTPCPNSLALHGSDIVTTCTICGAELCVSFPEWYGVFDEDATCRKCEEGTPFCSCENGPTVGGDS